jgi:hypothetical protein
MGLKYGHFRKGTRNTVQVLKRGAGEGWRRSVGPIAFNMEEYYTYNQGENKCPTYNKKKEG